MIRWIGLVFLLGGTVPTWAGECPYIAIQIGKTTVETIRQYCGEPERSVVGAESREYDYSNFSVSTGLRDDQVLQLRISDPRYQDENGVSPGMLESEFREQFPGFEYSKRTARDPASDNLYRFKHSRVAIITVR